VKSVDSRVFEQLKKYEKEDLLAIRTSNVFPGDVPALGYDPNAETTWCAAFILIF
jgi:hypothetical protein